jgi:hypothetical protein
MTSGLQDCWGLDVSLRTLHHKKSLVKKAQETAGQTTLRRHWNLKRTEIRLFTWNVPSLFRVGSLELGSLECLQISSLIHGRYYCYIRIKMQKRNDYLYYNCHDSKHIFGTIFVVNRRVSHTVIDFQPLGVRMLFTSENRFSFLISA